MVRQEIESLNQVVSDFGQDIDDWRTDGTRNSGNVLSNKKKKLYAFIQLRLFIDTGSFYGRNTNIIVIK